MADYQNKIIKIEYKDIGYEIKKLGLTKKYVADLLGITTQALYERIKQNKPSIHWEIYGISNYFANDDNLLINNEKIQCRTESTISTECQ